MFIMVEVHPGEGYKDDVAEGMLNISLGLNARHEFRFKGKSQVFWRCSAEFVQKFEATCVLLKIRVEIFKRTSNGEVRHLWRTSEQPQTLVS